MFKSFSIIAFLFFLLSCNCQKTPKTKEVVSEKSISSGKIRAFLTEKNFDIITSANLVVVFDIQKKLIEGTVDEYSNKIVLKDTLDLEKADGLLTNIKNDASYVWDMEKGTAPFNASQQLLIRNETGRIVLLIDQENRKLGFINLDGQKVITISESLLEYFKSF
ncbi:hypothetical protein J0X14_14575 [Muricauda sp. CAU 1633]|uniref:hypothetical protein n=1 Tax=Allomuricauda sp. CAU 1633 TaxID=2816036 RepID=UPI001A8FD26B|nr:hypothetical protein [Muricauda sp. CAU 1633]MBO0323531.1 hypothetical protein [Muricauda sp. CAU 1633]